MDPASAQRAVVFSCFVFRSEGIVGARYRLPGSGHPRKLVGEH